MIQNKQDWIKLTNAIKNALREMEKCPDDYVQDIWNEQLKSWETGLKMNHNYEIVRGGRISMKTGDIVVITKATPPINWPDNIRDGVITDVIDEHDCMVRPYGSLYAFKCKRITLRVILPNRFRKNRPPPLEAPKTKIEKKKFNKTSEYQTYRGWKLIGRYVCKGERHQKRDENGQCLFHLNQTMKKESSCGYSSYLSFNSNSEQEHSYKDYPHETSRSRFTGAMGAVYDRVYMSDGSFKDEWAGNPGEDDVPPGISLGM